MGDMNGQKKTNKAPREYLPSVESFSQKQPQKHGERIRKVVKGRASERKIGKKNWREYYKSIEFISKF